MTTRKPSIRKIVGMFYPSISQTLGLFSARSGVEQCWWWLLTSARVAAATFQLVGRRSPRCSWQPLCELPDIRVVVPHQHPQVTIPGDLRKFVYAEDLGQATCSLVSQVV